MLTHCVHLLYFTIEIFTVYFSIFEFLSKWQLTADETLLYLVCFSIFPLPLNFSLYFFFPIMKLVPRSLFGKRFRHLPDCLGAHTGTCSYASICICITSLEVRNGGPFLRPPPLHYFQLFSCRSFVSVCARCFLVEIEASRSRGCRNDSPYFFRVIFDFFMSIVYAFFVHTISTFVHHTYPSKWRRVVEASAPTSSFLIFL